jgi:hypothetical protein
MAATAKSSRRNGDLNGGLGASERTGAARGRARRPPVAANKTSDKKSAVSYTAKPPLARRETVVAVRGDAALVLIDFQEFAMRILRVDTVANNDVVKIDEHHHHFPF